MPTSAAIISEAQRLRDGFAALGAQPIEADVLQPAETLLDLYGEDIRARAYVTSDPIRGEMMLRPDFTVPVVQMHMESQAEPARYTYAGRVFRKQDHDASRANEYTQVGYEVFDGQNPAAADAEVFAAVSRALSHLPVRPATGDIGILTAAVAGLKTTDARKAALMRHIWRPRRFRALLDRFGGRSPVPPSRARLLARADPMQDAPPSIGLRSPQEVAARIDALRLDAAADPISGAELDLLDALLAIDEALPDAQAALRDIAVDLPALTPAVDRLARRGDALAQEGIDVDTLRFEGSYGRTSLEYYDGFVFGFYAIQANLPPIATGGRYDALTAQLGEGRSVPAIGAVIRPDLALLLGGDD